MEINTANVPKKMITQKQWICWETALRDGKETKLPKDPKTGGFAQTDDPDTWGTIAHAINHLKSGEADGIGFVFTEDDDLVGVDLDKCRDEESGEFEDWALDVMQEIGGYIEISPSGTGSHIILNGEIPGDRNRKGHLEMYEDGRYFTVTGDVVTPDGEYIGDDDPAPEINSNQDGLDAVYERFLGVDEDDDSSDESSVDVDLSDRDHLSLENHGEGASNPFSSSPNRDELSEEELELLNKAMGNAKIGFQFSQLWEGKWSGNYPSQSEADLAFCDYLAFYYSGDPERMDRVFRASGLVRPKWDDPHYSDGSTYGERTIEKALSEVDDYYDPDYHKKEVLDQGDDDTEGNTGPTDDEADSGDAETSSASSSEPETSSTNDSPETTNKSDSRKRRSDGQRGASKLTQGLLEKEPSEPQSDQDTTALSEGASTDSEEETETDDSTPDPDSPDQSPQRQSRGRGERKTTAEFTPLLNSSENTSTNTETSGTDDYEFDLDTEEDTDSIEEEDTTENSSNIEIVNDPYPDKPDFDSPDSNSSSETKKSGATAEDLGISEEKGQSIFGKDNEKNSVVNTEIASEGESSEVEEDNSTPEPSKEEDSEASVTPEGEQTSSDPDSDADTEAKQGAEDSETDPSENEDETESEPESESEDEGEKVVKKVVEISKEDYIDQRLSADIPPKAKEDIKELEGEMKALEEKMEESKRQWSNNIEVERDRFRKLHHQLIHYEKIVDRQEKQMEMVRRLFVLLCRTQSDPVFDQIENVLVEEKEIPVSAILEETGLEDYNPSDTSVIDAGSSESPTEDPSSESSDSPFTTVAEQSSDDSQDGETTPKRSGFSLSDLF